MTAGRSWILLALISLAASGCGDDPAQASDANTTLSGDTSTTIDTTDDTTPSGDTPTTPTDTMPPGDVGNEMDTADLSTDVATDAVLDAVDVNPEDSAQDTTDIVSDAAQDTDDASHDRADLNEPPLRDLISSDFTEVEGDIQNPGRGFYAWDWDDTADLVLVKQYLGDFCDGTSLSVELLAQLRARLSGHRTAGRTIILRFAYADDGDLNGCDLADAESVDVIEDHIAELAPIFAEYGDIIAYVEAGFLGMWGEWNSEHAPDGTSLVAAAANRRRVLAALLAVVPEGRQVLVRRPRFRAEWAEGPDTLGADLARVGFHNDCFLASADDYGTYDGERSIEAWKDYINDVALTVGMGGETCRDESLYTTCENATAELERLRFSYMHVNYHQDVVQRWRDEGCFDEIARRLGYRLIVRRVEYTSSAARGERIGLRLDIENVGYAAVHRPMEVTVVLQSADTSYALELESVSSQPTSWAPAATTTVDIVGSIPDAVVAGTYDLTVVIRDPLNSDPTYGIVFANADIVDAARRDAVVGEFEVR